MRKRDLVSQKALIDFGIPPSLERAELEQQVEALRQDIRRLRLEQDLLKKADELL